MPLTCRKAMWKKEKMLFSHNAKAKKVLFLFPQQTSVFSSLKKHTQQTIKQAVITYFSLNLFPNKPLFLHVCSRNLLKTTRKKEKLLVTSNFSFFHNVFLTRLENFPPFSSNLKLSSANSFSLEESQICRLGKG